jgi:hypothetical protein
MNEIQGYKRMEKSSLVLMGGNYEDCCYGI